jgi:ABC-type nickel/cobalt efflux system permease component RcnA
MVQGRRLSEEQPTDGLSIGSVVLGALGMIAWCIPLCGCPVSIVGLVLGIQAYLKGNRTLGVVGIVLCSLGLALTLINAAIGAYMGVTGQHPFVQLLRGRTP